MAFLSSYGDRGCASARAEAAHSHRFTSGLQDILHTHGDEKSLPAFFILAALVINGAADFVEHFDLLFIKHSLLQKIRPTLQCSFQTLAPAPLLYCGMI